SQLTSEYAALFADPAGQGRFHRESLGPARFAGLPAIAGASRCCRPALSWRQERKELAPNWPIFFASTGRVTVRRIAYQPLTDRSCGPLRSVAPRSWEVISKSATLAALSTRLITPAVTATVLNASRWPKPSG